MCGKSTKEIGLNVVSLIREEKEKMATNLFVGGIPFSTTEDQLIELFSEAGEVSRSRVITDRISGRSRGFAFVEMNSEDEANTAIEKFDGYSLDGRNIAVNVAREKRSNPPQRDFRRYDDRPGYGNR